MREWRRSETHALVRSVKHRVETLPKLSWQWPNAKSVSWRQKKKNRRGGKQADKDKKQEKSGENAQEGKSIDKVQPLARGGSKVTDDEVDEVAGATD